MLRALDAPAAPALNPTQRQALTVLEQRVTGLNFQPDTLLGTPKQIAAAEGFLTGPGGHGKAVSTDALNAFSADDPHRAIKAFLNEHSGLFGYNSDALGASTIRRDYVTSHNGLRTVVWEQNFQEVPVFAGVLMGHVTARQELVGVSSQFVPDPAIAAMRGNPQWAATLANPPISIEMAVVRAAADINERVDAGSVAALPPKNETLKLQKLKSPQLRDGTYAGLVWLPLGPDSMRLAWKVYLVSQVRRELFRMLVDAQTGEILMRHDLSCYQTAQPPAVGMSIFTSDSPSPFSPGLQTPGSFQPPTVARTHLTNFVALNLTASPKGWVYPATNGVYQTTGNNVDAHCDWDDNDEPDLPRPQVPQDNPDFTFPLDLAQPPTVSSNAVVVNLFYWNNFMHDKSYELGFTESAGNFQNDNFGRGGFGGDGVEADAQDGAGLNDPFGHANNANFYTVDDGVPGRMQMYLFNNPLPNRDGDLDAEIMCHEYTHGISNRLVGGGTLIWEFQSRGLGEGWSDFYSMALLSEPTDDPRACYATGGYATYLLGDLTENYYYGIRRYPYSTDLSKNPLTFKDIDYTQQDPHTGVPISPGVGVFISPYGSEVHNQGEVWCVALWDARANLVDSLGPDEGNRMMLQLVTDGMKLGPPNPNFLQARDAIIQADEVDTGGANRADLWVAFAKRGMGYSAKCPPANTTRGVVEAYDLPPDVVIRPPTGNLEININPVADSTLLGGANAAVYVRVRDGVGVTNATVKGLLNGQTEIIFNNIGTPPDARAKDSLYSTSIAVPSAGTSLTLTVAATAPGKTGITNTVTYYVAFRPSNDFYVNATKVSSVGGVYAANNKFAEPNLEAGEPDHDGVASASSSLWWSWTPTSNGRVLIDTGGSRFSTLLAVYTGKTVQSLTPVISTNTPPQGRKGYVFLDAKKGVNYSIAVASISTNNAGVINLSILPGAQPDLTGPIVSVSAPVDGLIINDNGVDVIANAFDPGPISSGVDKLTFVVKPISGAPFWNVAGVTGQSTNRIALTEGRNVIQVTATDGVGNISEPVELSVTYRRSPVPNDVFVYAETLPGASGTDSAHNTGATKEPGEPNHAGNSGGHSLWWRWTAPADGSLLLSTEGSSNIVARGALDTLLATYLGDRVGSLRMVAANDDATADVKFSKIQQGVRANQVYSIAVDGFNGVTGLVQLAYSFTPGKLFTIDLQTTPGGSVAEHDTGLVDVLANSSQTLTAVPDDGFLFAGWEGAVVTTANPVSVQVKSNLVMRATFRRLLYSDDFETGNLSKLAWVGGGNLPWLVTNTTAMSGRYAARSGAIGNGQVSKLSLTANCTAGPVTFSAKVSTEPTWDYLAFYIDGVQQIKWSGEVDWDTYSFPIAAGAHTFEWRYTKDQQNSAGLDAVFIDNFNAPLVPPVDNSSAPTLALERLPQGQYELRLKGQTNQVYVIYQTSDAPPGRGGAWQPFATNVASYGEIRIILDQGALGLPHTFYSASPK